MWLIKTLSSKFDWLFLKMIKERFYDYFWKYFLFFINIIQFVRERIIFKSLKCNSIVWLNVFSIPYNVVICNLPHFLSVQETRPLGLQVQVLQLSPLGTLSPTLTFLPLYLQTIKKWINAHFTKIVAPCISWNLV